MKNQTSTSHRIRPTTAELAGEAIAVLWKADAIAWEELQVIRLALKELAKRGELPREPEKRLLDIHQVAAKLAIGESTLKRLLTEGKINLPKVRIAGSVRFRLADVEALVDNVSEE